MAVNLLVGAPSASMAQPALVQVYNGLGTPRGGRIWGRVLEDEGITPPSKGEGWLSKFRRNFHALESDELPGAELELRVAGRKVRVKADREGLFEARLRGPLRPGRHPVSARLLADGEGARRKFRVEPGTLLIAPAKPGVAVISDIDDTVLQTGVEHKLRMARKVLTTSAYDLQTFTGAPELFRAWARRGYPVVFVSGSPVNLYPKLTRFLKLKGFPPAPLLLKDLGLKNLTEQKAYKLAHIATVARLLPGYRFILLGDDGEQDPEIYREVARRYPGRVELVLIHKVASKAAAVPAGQLHFADYPALTRLLRRRKQLADHELKERNK